MAETAVPPAVHDSTHRVVFPMTERKVFLFLRLPAELRNRVYDIILQRLEEAANPTHVSPNSATTCSYMGLAITNRQLIAEFLPLLIHGSVQVWLRAFPKFVNAFLRPDSVGLRPTIVKIVVGSKDANESHDLDTFPSLLARANDRGLRIEIAAIDSEDETTLPTGQLIRSHAVDHLVRSAQWLLSRTRRGFLRNIDSGYISAVRLKTHSSKRPEWIVTVVKKACGLRRINKDAGGLRRAERAKFERYCFNFQGSQRGSQFRSRRGHIVDITIEVVNGRGKHVERWYAYGCELVRKKAGDERWPSELSAKEQRNV
jgi:hypothetical protein